MERRAIKMVKTTARIRVSESGTVAARWRRNWVVVGLMGLCEREKWREG